MPPQQFFSIYRQYKQDTDAVASWLARTAKAGGYPADLLSKPSDQDDAAAASANNTSAKSKRSKGKARKGGKKAAKSSGGGCQKRKHIVAIRDMVPLAEFIASGTKRVVAVPDSFAMAVRRVIALRSGFGEKLANDGATPNPGSDKNHTYFVGVLEAVRDALRPRMSPEAAAAAAADDSVLEEAVRRLGSRFAGLTVQDSSDAFVEAFLAAETEVPKSKPKNAMVYEAEQLNSPEDMLLAYKMLLNDVDSIRSHVGGLWSKWLEGELHYSSCAVATDTAAALARGLIEEAEPAFAGYEGGLWGLATKVFSMTCVQKGRSESEVVVDAGKFNYDLYEEADSTYFVAHHILHKFVKDLYAEESGTTTPVISGYDPTIDRASKSGETKFRDDLELLNDHLMELLAVVRLLPVYLVEDEFIRSMAELDEITKLTLPLVFNAQLFLDFHHIVMDCARNPFLSMLDELRLMDQTLDRHLAFHQEIDIQDSPDILSLLHTVKSSIAAMRLDPVHLAKVQLMAKESQSIPTQGSHAVLALSPVLPGLYIFRMRLQMDALGMSVANTRGSVVAAAHLYNVLDSEGLMTEVWHDMRYAIQLLGPGNVWVGGKRPVGLADCWRKFCIQMGISVTEFANPNRSRNRPGIARSRAGPRSLNEGATVSLGYLKHVVEPNGNPSRGEQRLTTENIENIILLCQYKDDPSKQERYSPIMPNLGPPQNIQGRKKAQDRDGAKSGARLSPGKVVSSLASALDAEANELAFPWLVLHSVCWRLLDAVRTACEADVASALGPGQMKGGKELPFVVGHVMAASAGWQSRSARSGPMGAAASAADAVLKEDSGGAVCLELLRDIGLEMEELHPKGESHNDENKDTDGDKDKDGDKAEDKNKDKDEDKAEDKAEDKDEDKDEVKDEVKDEDEDEDKGGDVA